MAPISEHSAVKALPLVLSMLVAVCPICRAEMAPNEVDFLKAPGLASFQANDFWQRVASAEAIAGQSAIDARGEGSLLFNAREKDTTIPYLLTRESFGDVRVSLEFMIPQGSNAGIYLMGRYEIQIFDSHGEDLLDSADHGGVYAQWDRTQPKEKQWSGGSAPLANAAPPPGTWQTMEIVFRAPRFDASGQKVRNARFESVKIDGKVVQQSVEVSAPTASHPLPGEVPSGPLAIQGDHGPIAIRRFIATSLPAEDSPGPEEIDAYWAEVSRCVREGDYEGYRRTCHPLGVLVSGTKQTSQPLSQALIRWKKDFDQTRQGLVESSVDFRFSHRYRDASTSHESGVFRYTSKPKGGESITEYIAFDAVLVKTGEAWQILLESQNRKVTEKDWLALPP